MTAGLSIVKSVLIPLAKSVSLSFEISAWISAADVAIQKNIHGSGSTKFQMKKFKT